MRFLTLIAVLLFVSCSEKQEKVLSPLDKEIAQIENGLLPRIVIEGVPTPAININQRMKELNVPGVSVAVVKDGALHFAKGYGAANTTTGTQVNENTLFQAGSISKPLAALGALKLAQEGKVDMDTDVNQYLTSWKLPSNELTEAAPVTLRMLLTHTAGTTVHGFPGYAQSEAIPSTVGVLKGEGNTDEIFVDTAPGTNWRYSGGGYTIMEKVVEDVTGKELNEYLDAEILQPLGMTHSTYAQPLPKELHKNASAAYGQDGAILAGFWNNYPEQAAAGLWTTPSDLAKYYMAVQEIVAGKTDGFLSQETINGMLTKHQNGWGLGPTLRGEGDKMMFGHGGKNAGFTNNMMGFVHNGNAVIVMTNGDNGGQVAMELIAGISGHYDWDMATPEKIKLMEMTEVEMQKFTGAFKTVEQFLPEGDYIVEISIKGDTMIAKDTIDGSVKEFKALKPDTFVNISNGNQLVFLSNEAGEVTGFTYNGGTLEFVKM